MNLDARSNEEEIMDNLALGGEEMDQTLRELEVINRLLGGDHVTLAGVKKLLKLNPGQLRIADIGCGGGDMALKIANVARKMGRQVKVTGVDANPYIVAYAVKHCAHEPMVDFKAIDIFSSAFLTMPLDIVTATLFLHHFTDQQLIDLFSAMKQKVRVGMVINDIHRHRVAYHSIRILTKLFSKSPMVQNDGPLSVRRAFKRSDLVSIMKKAGIENYELKWKWAFRWQLVICNQQAVDSSR
jgi:2-polyprenyl-3-methyl-5-hydroxy-6-metoxy-1,4-benzoquinol methylase